MSDFAFSTSERRPQQKGERRLAISSRIAEARPMSRSGVHVVYTGGETMAIWTMWSCSPHENYSDDIRKKVALVTTTYPSAEFFQCLFGKNLRGCPQIQRHLTSEGLQNVICYGQSTRQQLHLRQVAVANSGMSGKFFFIILFIHKLTLQQTKITKTSNLADKSLIIKLHPTIHIYCCSSRGLCFRV